MRATSTFAIMPVSKAAFDEIRAALEEAGCDHAVLEDTNGNQAPLLNMHGIALEAKVES